VSLDLESTKWRRELEWPEEVVGLLELWSAGGDFVDEVLDARDTDLAEFSSDDGVVSKWDSASVNLTISSLVDQVADGGSGWETVSHEWLDHSDHVPGGLVKLNESTVVELSQSKELQDLLWLWSKLVDTLDSDNESNLWLTLNVEGSSGLGISLGFDKSGISSGVLLVVLFGVVGSNLSGSGSILLGFSSGIGKSLKDLSISSLLLEDVLWNVLSTSTRSDNEKMRNGTYPPAFLAGAALAGAGAAFFGVFGGAFFGGIWVLNK